MARAGWIVCGVILGLGPAGCGGGGAGSGERPIDRGLADRGERLLGTKGCTACHTVGGGRLVGPDLAGVTRRRDESFILGMISHPDSMLNADPTAREMLAEYFTPMPDQAVEPGEARAILEHLRRYDSTGGGGGG
jgi:mono/diheme cytochrome c family protein